MKPFVSVLTPVYNGDEYLVECIESVLRQTYENYEYIIINNCSTDRTMEIALAYAAKNPRIRVHSNEKFVGVIENHNLAFGLISPDAKYCKVVSADDAILPDCISQMVEVAEANPSAGFIGCYQISEKSVKWQGFPYPKTLLSGRELCREIFLRGDPSFGFGTPTSLMYRADLVRSSERFYPNPSPHADTSACFKHLKDWDFAFVYQVLSFERIHQKTQSSASGELNRYSSAYLNDVQEYGLYYLNTAEHEQVLKKVLNSYFEFLAVNINRDREFWNYHKSRLKELGHPVSRWKLFVAGARRILREIVNPGRALRKSRKRLSEISR